jgi:hypothetical protein
MEEVVMTVAAVSVIHSQAQKIILIAYNFLENV